MKGYILWNGCLAWSMTTMKSRKKGWRTAWEEENKGRGKSSVHWRVAGLLLLCIGMYLIVVWFAQCRTLLTGVIKSPSQVMSKQAFTVNRLFPLSLQLSYSSSFLFFFVSIGKQKAIISDIIWIFQISHKISFPSASWYYFYQLRSSSWSFHTTFSLCYSFIKLLSKNEQWDLLSWKVNSILLFSFLGVLSRSFLVSWSFNRYIILLPGITDPDRVRVFHESLCTSFELVLIVFIQCQLLFLLASNWFRYCWPHR